MRVYQGRRLQGGSVEVTRNGRVFSPAASLRVRNHSPDGFQWGYGGSGPAQLALALLIDVIGSKEAQKVYQRFKTATVAGWGDEWRITDEDIFVWYLQATGEFPGREAYLDL